MIKWHTGVPSLNLKKKNHLNIKSLNKIAEIYRDIVHRIIVIFC